MSVDIVAASPGRQGLTQWSRCDPIRMESGHTDNWAKMKIRALTNTEDPAAQASAKTFTFIDLREENRRRQQEPTKCQSQSATPRAPGAQYGDGRVDPVGDPIMSRVSLRDCHGAGPKNYSLPPVRHPSSRSVVRTSYNMRAKTGYKYWYQERPKPTKFGRYGIGSYKTVLGLGSAPRT